MERIVWGKFVCSEQKVLCGDIFIFPSFFVSVGHVCVRVDFRMILFSSLAVHWNNLCFRGPSVFIDDWQRLHFLGWIVKCCARRASISCVDFWCAAVSA